VCTAGLPQPDLEETARNAWMMDRNDDNLPGHRWSRVLRLGHKGTGAIALRGDHLSPIVVDAIASIAAIALERSRSLEKETRAEAARQSEQLRTAVLDALAHFGRGVHHLLIVDDTGKVVNLLSQTDVIRFVAKDVAGLDKLREQSIRTLGLGVRPVFAVRNTDSALDAFYELSEAGVSGGAIINPEGKLVGNFSRYDLKGTQGGTGFKVLSQSIMHYQRKHRVALAQRLVTVNPDMAIGDVVSTMAREKVHRVFAVEGGMYPKGCVTQTDVCRVIYEHFMGTNIPTKGQVKELMKTHISRALQFPLVFPPQ